MRMQRWCFIVRICASASKACVCRAPLSDLELALPSDAQKSKTLALFQELDLSTSTRNLQKFWHALEYEQNGAQSV